MLDRAAALDPPASAQDRPKGAGVRHHLGHGGNPGAPGDPDGEQGGQRQAAAGAESGQGPQQAQVHGRRPEGRVQEARSVL